MVKCFIHLLFPFEILICFIILNLCFHLPDESLLRRFQDLEIKGSMGPYLIVPMNKFLLCLESMPMPDISAKPFFYLAVALRMLNPA